MARAAADPLAEYNRKRDFGKTAEPAGKRARGASGHLFIVQKHEATRLHWDFRLEVDGVLKSWAVTKGPSPIPISSGWRCGPRIIRWPMPNSKARSPGANTAAAR